jgi:hypothetical protein
MGCPSINYYSEPEFSADDPAGKEKYSGEGFQAQKVQITFVLKQAGDATPICEMCRKAGIWNTPLL